MSDPALRPTRLAGAAIRIAALWILAGALFKLFLGTPADLPRLARELPISLGLTYKLAITIEIAVASLALLRPRWGWPAIAATFLVFGSVLVTQIAQGAASCGCFGAKVPIPPWIMLAIDGTLLTTVLVTRPWALPGGGTHGVFVAVAVFAGIALPWALDREVSAPASGVGETVSGRYVDLDIEKIVGQPIDSTKIAQWMEEDVHSLPADGLWVLYRHNCEHCAAELERLAREPPPYPFLVLVRLKEKSDTEQNRKVFVMPTGPNVVNASLRDSVEYIITTPGELVVEDGKIVSAREAADEKK